MHLRDFNAKIKIATLNAEVKGSTSVFHGDQNESVPLKGFQNLKNGAFSQNQLHANSISLGDGITMRRIYLPAVPTGRKTKDGDDIMLDRGFKYVVRPPNGEAEFTNEPDFMLLWGVAIGKAEGFENYSAWVKNVRDETLRKIAGGPATLERSKAEQLRHAKQKMVDLGVEKTANLDKLIAKKLAAEKGLVD